MGDSSHRFTLSTMQKDGSTPIRAIDPSSLHGPSSRVGARRSPVAVRMLVALVFIVLAGCVVVVFLVLPEYVNEARQPDRTVSSPARTEDTPRETASPPARPVPVVPDAPAPSGPAQQAMKRQAEALLLDIIEKQEWLRQRGVSLWAAGEYDLAASAGQAGDEAFRTRAFSEAVRHYEQALHALHALERRAAQVLGEQLVLGEEALERNQGETAMRHFELAQAIDPRNPRVMNGLKRANTIHALFSLLEKGGNLEAAGRFPEAERTYRQAVELDPLAADARTALQRVTAQLTGEQFRKLVAQGYAWLDARRFQDAREAFRKAHKLMPDSKQPAKGLASVDQAVHDEKVESLKIEAEHFELQQEWGLALQSWQQLLGLEPGAGYAVEGAARARLRDALLERLENHIRAPQRLSSAGVAAEARALLDEVAAVKGGPGNRILDRAAVLEETLVLANRPVPITLQSDNETDVTLLRVGRLGRFQRHEILLKPGRYTLVGSRPGYRDIRKILDVTLGMETGRLTIRCEETI